MQNGLQSVFVTDQDFVDNFRPGESADGFKPGTGRDISGNQLSAGEDMELPQSGKGISGITYTSQSHSAAPIVFHVGVDNKSTAHPWQGGSTLAYYINGQEAPFLKLKKGVYHFDVSHVSNAGHPFKLYTAADKAGGPWSTEIGGANNPSALSVEFWEGGTQRDESTYDAVVGQAGVYLKVTIASDSPQILHYQCSAHQYMGFEIKNESAVSAGGGGGATAAGDLSDVQTGGAQNGDALVFDGANFSQKPILSQEDAFASDRITFSAAGLSAEIIQLHPNIEGHSGGRIVIDTTNLGAHTGDKLQLNLSELYNPANPLMNTMNFEIFSIGTQPFSVEVTNPASGPASNAQTLHSDMQSDITINEGDTASISLGEGQMLIIYCDADSGWYHEIRSGL